MAKSKGWVFSLALDDTIRWAAAEVGGDGQFRSGSFRSTTQPLYPLVETKRQDLGAVVTGVLERLKALSTEYARLFERVRAIGVSCPGIIDTAGGRLLNIDRKRWLPRPTTARPYMVDFKELLAGSLFPDVDASLVCVHNDVTAKCLAEWDEQRRGVHFSETIASLWYMNLHRGINASVLATDDSAATEVSNAREIRLRSLLHHEMGHQALRPDPEDEFGAIYSACPVHKYCFTGLASGNRALNEWGHMLPTLDRGLSSTAEQAWHFLPRYMAAFVYNALLTVQVDRVVLAGGMVTPAIIQLIAEHVRSLNAYEGRPYVDFTPLASASFMVPARLDIEMAGVIGGLDLARRLLVDPQTPPVTPFLSAV